MDGQCYGLDSASGMAYMEAGMAARTQDGAVVERTRQVEERAKRKEMEAAVATRVNAIIDALFPESTDRNLSATRTSPSARFWDSFGMTWSVLVDNMAQVVRANYATTHRALEEDYL